MMDIRSSENQFPAPSMTLPDEANFFVIVGGNNSGKSTFLREVVKTFGDSAFRVMLTGLF